MALIVFIDGIGSSRVQGTSGPGCRRCWKWGSVALMVGQRLLARILANHGQPGDAKQLVRSAMAPGAPTDLLSERADTLLELSHVRAAAARVSEVHSAAALGAEPLPARGQPARNPGVAPILAQ
jgi:hypothetical protein